MNSKKAFYLLVAVLCLTLVGAAYMTIQGTKMIKKSGDVLLQQKLEQAALEKDEQALLQAKRDIEKYKELLQVAKSIVPQEKDQARTVRELVSLAQQSGISIESISFPASTLGQKQTGMKKGSNKQQTGPEGTTQLVPVEGLSNVYAMPITVTVNEANSVTYDQLLAFLGKLEQNRRTSHVTNLTITPSQDDRSKVTFELQLNAYIKP